MYRSSLTIIVFIFTDISIWPMYRPIVNWQHIENWCQERHYNFEQITESFHEQRKSRSVGFFFFSRLRICQKKNKCRKLFSEFQLAWNVSIAKTSLQFPKVIFHSELRRQLGSELNWKLSYLWKKWVWERGVNLFWEKNEDSGKISCDNDNIPYQK